MKAPKQVVGNINEEPKKEGTSDPIVIPAAVLERFADDEKDISRLKDRLGLVTNTTNVVTLVVFVLVVAIVLGAIYQFIGSIDSDRDSRDKLTESVNELRVQVEVLQKTQTDTTTAQTPVQ